MDAPHDADRAHAKLAESASKLKDSAVQQVDSADRRTELAADRTILAGERTYAAWVRTGLAALASGIGARAAQGRRVPVAGDGDRDHADLVQRLLLRRCGVARDGRRRPAATTGHQAPASDVAPSDERVSHARVTGRARRHLDGTLVAAIPRFAASRSDPAAHPRLSCGITPL
ncbi:DUF202 domain-containing protein [Sphingomonas sp. LR55]|uniref:DUF202 domain-containing protein n=1 Tax=Sphingomonas sp. LR55 TaxID=3050231 RepID=UPI003FA7EC84